jgi:hypothetical protein
VLNNAITSLIVTVNEPINITSQQHIKKPEPRGEMFSTFTEFVWVWLNLNISVEGTEVVIEESNGVRCGEKTRR